MLDPFLSPLALVLVGALIFRQRSSAAFVAQLALLPPILVASMIWLATASLAVILLGYGPPRYYLPLAVPVLLIATSVFANPGVWPLSSVFLGRARAFALLGLLLAGVRLSIDLASPHYTLLATIDEIAELVHGEASTSGQLTGSGADTVNLETGLPSVNLYVSDRRLTRRPERVPTHLVSIGSLQSAHWRALEDGVRPVLIKTYDVMDNYKGGLLLYRLETAASESMRARARHDLTPTIP